jgi:hypothetical protein
MPLKKIIQRYSPTPNLSYDDFATKDEHLEQINAIASTRDNQISRGLISYKANYRSEDGLTSSTELHFPNAQAYTTHTSEIHSIIESANADYKFANAKFRHQTKTVRIIEYFYTKD